jgi:hypothetical protein
MENSSKHWWSGWPGAFCCKCGQNDLEEVAVGRGHLDPFTGKWESEELRRLFSNGTCLVTDEAYRVWLIRNGKEVPQWVGGPGRE